MGSTKLAWLVTAEPRACTTCTPLPSPVVEVGAPMVVLVLVTCTVVLPVALPPSAMISLSLGEPLASR